MSPGGSGRNDRLPPSSQCRLLEITVISAQDLHQCSSRKVEAYATAWVDPAQKLRTQVDLAGRADPTWNDKFVFRVDAAFLRSETAAITVAVHAARGRLSVREDPVLGIARIVVSTFVRPSASPGPSNRKVVALQLRRPRSLRPQGILNVAVALLDVNNYAHSMPLYYAPGSPNAFALKDLMTRPKSTSKIDEDVVEAAFIECQPTFVDRSGPLEASRSIELEERKALQSKLEKWKTELSPDRREVDRPGGARRRRSSFCLCGSLEWEQ